MGVPKGKDIKSKWILGALALSVVTGSQAVGYDANFYSQTFFDVFADAGIDIQTNPYNGGPYMNFPPSESGDGMNYGNDFRSNFGGSGGYVYASCGSCAFLGHATQFQGMSYFLDFINTTSDYLDFGVECTHQASVNTSGIATAISYGGVYEYGGANAFRFLQLTSIDGGAAVVSGQDYHSLNFINSQSYSAMFGFVDTLGPGETMTVQIWASGSTEAGLVPEPATLAVLGLGILALRRRKK